MAEALLTVVPRSRVRAIHRRMSWAAFQDLPRRLGWKHEYYGGQAHITPHHLAVTLVLDLAARKLARRNGIRRISPTDAQALQAPFLAAFSQAPEYANYSAREFRQEAAKYFDRFFGECRGRWSPVSVVAEAAGQLIGAALVKERKSGYLLDCVFIHPLYGRQGWATTLASRAIRDLRAQGASRIYSYAHVANQTSLAWHLRFGFRELPDIWVATNRLRYYEYELKRRRQRGDISPLEMSELELQTIRWRKEVNRLHKLEDRDFWAAHPSLD